MGWDLFLGEKRREKEVEKGNKMGTEEGRAKKEGERRWDGR